MKLNQIAFIVVQQVCRYVGIKTGSKNGRKFCIGLSKVHGRIRISLPKMHGGIRIDLPKVHGRFRISLRHV